VTAGIGGGRQSDRWRVNWVVRNVARPMSDGASEACTLYLSAVQSTMVWYLVGTRPAQGFFGRRYSVEMTDGAGWPCAGPESGRVLFLQLGPRVGLLMDTEFNRDVWRVTNKPHDREHEVE